MFQSRRHRERVALERERQRLADRARLEEALAPYVRRSAVAGRRVKTRRRRETPRVSKPGNQQ